MSLDKGLKCKDNYYPAPVVVTNCFSEEEKEHNWYLDIMTDRFDFCDSTCYSCYQKEKNNCLTCFPLDEKPENAYFPFTQGKGIIHCIKLFDEPNQTNDNPLNFTKDLSQDSISSTKSKNKDKDILSQTLTEKNSTYNFNEEENSLYSEQTVNINDDSLFKKKKKKYFYTPNGKRRRIKKNSSRLYKQ